MSATPVTQSSLLIRIRDRQDRESWAEFVAIYAPLVYGFLRNRGLQDADAADLTQDVMTVVSDKMKSFDYNPQHGTFRSWLFTIVRNRLANFFRDQAGRPRGTGETKTLDMLQQHPDHQNGQVEDWDATYEKRLFLYAAQRVRHRFQDSTWEAFYRTAIQGQRAADVAQDLQMSAPAVLMAKGRVIQRIKDQVRLVEES